MIPIRDDNPHRGSPLATYTIIGINVAVFLLEMSIPATEIEAFIERFAFIPGRESGGGSTPWLWQVATLFSSMFLHGGFLHLAANMWSLFIFGDNVEYRMGSGRYVAFYLLTGLAAGLTHWITNAGSTVPTVGASGAISGVMGAYVVMFPRAQVVMLFPIFLIPFFFRISAWVYLGFWIVGQLVSGAGMLMAGDGAEGGGVAYWAHIGGFAAGAALYRVFLRSEDCPPQPDEMGMEAAWSWDRR